jgi:4-hydroxy-4-methyl-2-oxoglutarate aldolase
MSIEYRDERAPQDASALDRHELALLVERAAAHPTATLHEAAGRVGSLPPTIKPVHPQDRLSGPAFTVRCAPGHNLAIHHAIQQASPGDVLVVDVGAGQEFGYWGEVLSEAAKASGLAGLVINGCVRDKAELADVGFPVFSTGLCIRGTGKSTTGSAIGIPVTVGDVVVSPTDVVVGDIDGVVVLTAATAGAVSDAAVERTAKELDIIARIRRGESTVDIYGFPTLDAQ